ncbi:helix-turn-helix domain-containing protein [Streptomyces lasiicapitis]|uniref:helix-turn-helix domain-containing protein n=1 Tax=Streptomyces lasiicapitis TaxID=1923961 RepID=UPI0036B397E0
MRYAQGGGLTDERWEFREGIRQVAAERFARGEASSVIAKDLRISVRSVQRWRKAWTKGGPRALRSAGSASPPRPSEAQFAQLEAELIKGPLAHGWPDQRWTLTRVKTVIGRRFHKSYTIQGYRRGGGISTRPLATVVPSPGGLPTASSVGFHVSTT